MTGPEVLDLAKRSGVSVRLLESGKIRLGGDPAGVAEIQPGIIQHRAEIIELLRKEPATDPATDEEGFSL